MRCRAIYCTLLKLQSTFISHNVCALLPKMHCKMQMNIKQTNQLLNKLSIKFFFLVFPFVNVLDGKKKIEMKDFYTKKMTFDVDSTSDESFILSLASDRGAVKAKLENN